MCFWFWRRAVYFFVLIMFGCVVLGGCSSNLGQSVSENPASESSSPWPMFHCRATHTGKSDYAGPSTATLCWKYTHCEIDGGTLPNSFVVSRDNIIFVTAANKLLSLSASGDLLWSASLEGTGGTALSTDEAMVYAVGESVLYAFTFSGEAVWTYEEAGNHIYGEPCVARDGTIYFGSWDTYVYALNPDGSLRWRYQTDGAIAPLASPSLSNDESTVYVGSGDPNQDEGGTLYAIGVSGELLWKKESIDGVRVSGVVVGPDNNLYVCAQGKLHCYSSSGALVWESAEDTAGSLIPALSASAETIYVGTSRDGKVYAINTNDGSTRWSYQTGRNADYDPTDPHDPEYGVLTAPIIGADGIVYVGAVDGLMYALNPDGTLLWSYETQGSIHENSPAIGPNGALYFSSADKYVYCIKDE